MSAATIRPTTLKIDPDTKARMQRLADVRHRSSHWLMLEAIRQFVDREEKREVFRQDGINRLLKNGWDGWSPGTEKMG